MSILKQILGDLYTPEIEKAVGDKQLAVINDGSYVPKSKLDSVLEDNKALKGQVAERDTQISDLSKKAGDNADLKAQFDKIKAENEAAAAKHAEDLKQKEFDHRLELAILASKPKNAKALKALLDVSKVKLDGETLLGLDDQLKALQKSDAYLFGEEENKGAGGSGNPAAGSGAGQKNPWDKATFNLTEQGRIFKENPALAATLKAAAGIK